MASPGDIHYPDRRKNKPAAGFVGESAGFTVAEFVSMGTSLGVVAVADKIAPNLLASASKALSKTVILPYLDTIEKSLGNVCKLEECKLDKTKPREERAEKIAHTLVVFSAAWTAAMAAKIGTRRLVNEHCLNIKDPPTQKWYHLSKPERVIIALDEGVHYGSLILLNTGVAEYTDDLIRATTKMLHKAGLSEKKAHELSSMAMVWELPNFLGLGAGIFGIYGKHKYGWGDYRKPGSHLDRLSDGHGHGPVKK